MSTMKAIGLRIKSGFAIAAVVSQSRDGFAIEAVRTVALSSDELPQSRFPYPSDDRTVRTTGRRAFRQGREGSAPDRRA